MLCSQPSCRDIATCYHFQHGRIVSYYCKPHGLYNQRLFQCMSAPQEPIDKNYMLQIKEGIRYMEEPILCRDMGPRTVRCEIDPSCIFPAIDYYYISSWDPVFYCWIHEATARARAKDNAHTLLLLIAPYVGQIANIVSPSESSDDRNLFDLDCVD